MKLGEWIEQEHPGRGGPMWFVRLANTSYKTLEKALAGELSSKSAAKRLSAATGGAVSVATLMGIDAPPKRRTRAA